MVRIQGATLIERSVEDVFDFVADELNEPRQNPHMVRSEKTTPGPVGEGTRWTATVLSRGRPIDVDVEVTGFERPTRLASFTSMSTANIEGELTFEPHPVGTRMSWSWELRPKGAFLLVGPLFALVGEGPDAEIWTELKRYLEDGCPRP